MQNIYVDDGEAKKFAAVDEQGNLLPVRKWDDLIKRYSPARLYTENSYQAKHYGEHNRILDLALAHCSEILTINPSVTATKRFLWGLPKGTDEDDANVLRRIAQTTNVHWSKARPRELKVPNLQQKADKIRVAKVLGRYAKMDGNYLVRGCFGNSTYTGWDAKSTKIFLAVAHEAADRKDFIERMGMSADGKRGLPRATFYRRIRALVNRAAPPYTAKKPDYKTDPLGYLAWKAGRMQVRNVLWTPIQRNMRRACIQLYHLCREDNVGSKDKRRSRDEVVGKVARTKRARKTNCAPATSISGGQQCLFTPTNAATAERTSNGE